MRFYIQESSSEDRCELILGTWCMAAHDVEKSVSMTAANSWTSSVSHHEAEAARIYLSSSTMALLISFMSRTLYDPLGVYAYINPPAPTAQPPAAHAKRVHGKLVLPVHQTEEVEPRPKFEEDDESEQDKVGRLRVSALGTLRWIIGNSHVPSMYTIGMPALIDPTESQKKDTSIATNGQLTSLLSSATLWSGFSGSASTTFYEGTSLGHEQTLVRRSTWLVLESLINIWKGVYVVDKQRSVTLC